MSKALTFIKETSIVWKTALGSAASWKLAQLAGSSHPYLAPLTLILSLQATLNQSIQFAIHRMFGTAVGIFITVILASFFSVSFCSIGLLIFIGAAIAKLFKMSNVVIHQIALSILLVFTFAKQTPDYGVDRLRDTVIGALIAIAFTALIFPSDFTKKAKNQFLSLTDALIHHLSQTAAWTAGGCAIVEGDRLHKDTQAFLKELHQLHTLLEKAMKDLRYNPYRKKHQKEADLLNNQLLHLQQGYTHISGMLRILLDWSQSGTMTAFDRTLWSSYLYSLAAYISEWKNSLGQKELRQNRPAYTIDLPGEMEDAIHPFSLYNEALEMLKDFKANVKPLTSQ